MIHLLRPNPNFCHRVHAISWSLRVLFFSTETPTSFSPSFFSAPIDSLDRRISRAREPRASIIPILDKWVEEGNNVTLKELQKFIRKLRKVHRFNHALQISQWMIGRPGYNLSTIDDAVWLDLISKVHGLEQAEKYFDWIPDNGRGVEVYGALLNCYAQCKCLEKAEATMQKMREMGFLRNTLSYNVMLNLYSKMRKDKKVDILMQEMEEKGISYNRVTYRIRLNAYADNPNIVEMEKLLMKMEADRLRIDWCAYVVAANAYLKAGLIEKSLTMLKRSEQLIQNNSGRSTYESLLTSYAAVGNKDEVYRVWNLYKNIERFKNSGYPCMISSLIKLDDVDGAETAWEEWVSKKTLCDTRIRNVMIISYSKKGLWEKADAFVNKIVRNGTQLEASTWDCLATAYHVGGQMGKAVETIKIAILVSKPGWKPNIYTFAACLEYLKGQGDVKAAEELFNIFSERHHVSTAVYDILKDCANNGNLSTKALVQMEGNNQTVNREMPAVMDFNDENSTEL